MSEQVDHEIDEIREIRRRISSEHEHDLRKIAAYYRGVEMELRAAGEFRFSDEQPAQPSIQSNPVEAANANAI